MNTQKLAPTQITDAQVLDQCKKTLNNWSNKLPFTVTRNLGDAVELVSANMYHAYSFGVDTAFAQRKFDLQKGGTPVSSPVDKDSLDLWRIAGVKDEGDFDFAIKETCYRETCDHCHGDGKTTCDECGGKGKVECPSCEGKGEGKCKNCHGYGELRCDKCAGGGKVDSMFKTSSFNTRDGEIRVGNSDVWKPCPRCHGSARIKCDTCHGSGIVKCKKCSGRGEVTCGKCKGKGVIVCAECDGRGWNSFTWHLIQSEKNDALNLMFYDIGMPEKREQKECKKYQATSVFAETAKTSQVDLSGIPANCSDFATELRTKWSETHSKFEGHDDVRVREQKVELIQYDALIRYEYKYKDKTYLIWIDLANKRVFEGAEGGLFAEWSAQVAKEGDKYSGKNPQLAIKNYAMACAISKDNKEPAKKLGKQLRLGSWLFRLATAGLGGWLWTVFFASQGVDAKIGWYVAAALVVADIIFASKRLWLSFVAAAGVYGFIGYLFPELMPPDVAAKMQDVQRLLPPEITGNVLLRDYIVCSFLLWVGGTLLFARDLALRIRGGIIVFPILGALVGAAFAPTGYLDFAKDPSAFIMYYKWATYGVCGFAVLRTLSRAFVQNCGRNAQKFPNFLIRLEARTLHPTYWLIPVYALLFAGIGAAWYFFAGPGVSIEEKAQAAERFLQSEQNQARGKYYLELTAENGYGPSVARLAELKVFGKCGYEIAAQDGYELAKKAADMNIPKGHWLQGYCLEFGKGVSQNLTDAHACYVKGAKLGDIESQAAEKKTADIAAVWSPAHQNDADAQYKLAFCYLDGNGIAKNDTTARTWLTKAADANHVKAQMTLCDWLIKGIGGTKDPERGVKYCEKAANQNDPEAIAVLGYYYFDGKVVKKDYKKAIESFERACKTGSESAPYMLGYCYREGLGVAKNATKGFEYFKLSFERGSLPGAYACGECYETANGTAVDYSAALACYTKSAEKQWDAPLLGKSVSDAKSSVARIAAIGKWWKPANEGDAVAMDKVGECFANGTGVKKDDKTAYGWYAKSAEKGCVDGIIHFADALYKGVGVAADKNAAGNAYAKAASKGNAYGLFMQGECHEFGFGVEKNLTSAYRCYQDAAKKQFAKANAAAKRIDEPARYWDEAFKKKDAKAQYALATCYSRGNCGVEKNDAEAFKLFRMSADQEFADALFEVSKCYAKGIGTAQNDTEMNKAVAAAAKLNHAKSLFFLGELYQIGRSVSRNLTLAKSCFDKAAKAGFAEGTTRAKMIERVAKDWSSAVGGDANAQFDLGVCYRDGIEIAQDLEEARKWFEKAVAQGHHDAEYALAVENEILAKGDESAITKNVIALLQKAVAANHIQAKTMLGKFLYSGKGIDEDYERAVKLWEETAAAGDLEAKYYLADYYYTGRGLFNSGKDQDKAIKVWDEAAKAGNVSSMLRLGTLYAKGSGMFGSGKDVAKATFYLSKAIDSGSRDAMKVLGEMLLDSDSDKEKAKGKEWLEKAKSAPANTNPNLKWYSQSMILE